MNFTCSIEARLTQLSQMRHDLSDAREQAGYLRGLMENEKEQTIADIRKHAEKKID